MISKDLKSQVLFSPLQLHVNQLYIVSGYATPNMVSWFMKNIDLPANQEIDISLIVGMPPYDGISVSVHDGFKELTQEALPKGVHSFSCSYIFQNAPVHTKLYVWCKDGVPVKAFQGSANFTQSAFGANRRELMDECNAEEALQYYHSLEADSIYCNHAEVEEYIILHPTHPILDKENHPNSAFEDSGLDYVTLSLLARGGETGTKSGLNWGQRKGRNPNQAYIGLPRNIAKTGFFPLGKKHFTVVTDDGHQLIMRVEQENDKAITTPLSNALLGEYFRNRLGLGNGDYVWRNDLVEYGRTDVRIYKFDDEQYYMDFST